jgi:hypothetical protein
MIAKRIAVVAGAVGALVAGAGVSLASVTAASAPALKATTATVYTVCAKNHVVKFFSPGSVACPSGTNRYSLGSMGPKGATGAKGQAGASADSLAGMWTLPAASQGESIPTGGKAYENASLLGSLTLQPGTYLLSATFVATPDAVNAASVFPQMLLTAGGAIVSGYGTSFWNVGAAALESPTATEVSGGDLVNSSYSGTDVLTVTSAETVDVYGFGYDSDSGAGSYTLNAATLAAVQIGS